MPEKETKKVLEKVSVESEVKDQIQVLGLKLDLFEYQVVGLAVRRLAEESGSGAGASAKLSASAQSLATARELEAALSAAQSRIMLLYELTAVGLEMAAMDPKRFNKAMKLLEAYEAEENVTNRTFRHLAGMILHEKRAEPPIPKATGPIDRRPQRKPRTGTGD